MSRTSLRDRRITQKEIAGWVKDPRSVIDGARVNFQHGYSPNEFYIVIHDDKGPSMRIRISKGPAGIGFEASSVAGSADMTVSGNESGVHASVIPPIDAREVSGTIYFADEWSQAFRAWARKEGEYPGDKPSS